MYVRNLLLPTIVVVASLLLLFGLLQQQSFTTRSLLGEEAAPLTTISAESKGKKKGKSKKPKNFLVILTDDQGYNDIGYEDPLFKTPTIDALADSGLKLTRLYVHSSCSPTRGALLTGRLDFNIGLGDGGLTPGDDRALATNVPTLPEILKSEAGYRTVGIGKWHLGAKLVSELPTSRGFDEYFGMVHGAADFYDYDLGIGCNSANPVNPDSLPPFWNSNCFIFNGYTMIDNEAPATEFIGQKIYATELFGMKAVEKIEEHDPETPLFMYLAPTAPHTPLQAPQSYIDRCGAVPDPAGTVVPGSRQLVCAMMAAVDDMVKNVTDALENKGMLEDTMIVYLSDNGGITPYGGSNGIFRGQKGSFFDGGVRSNGFVAGAGVGKSGTIDGLVHVTDIFSTIADFAGISKDSAALSDPDVYGQSIVKNLRNGKKKIKRDSILIGRLGYLYSGNGSATTYEYGGKYWKLMSNPNTISVIAGYDPSFLNESFFFNLDDDPSEQTNLYDIAVALPPLPEDAEEDSSSEDSSEFDPDLLLRGAFERGQELLAEMDGVVSVADQAGGVFLGTYGPTTFGCWLPVDTTFGGTDCGEFPVIPLPQPQVIQSPFTPP